MQQTQSRTARFFIFGFFIALAVIFVDQYTKWLVLETVLRSDSETPDFLAWFQTARPLSYFIDHQDKYKTDTLAPFLNLVMVWNKGISFGMFDTNSPKLPLLFVGLSLMISLALLGWMIVMRRPVITVATALIIGGALANVIDRLRFQAVADFIDFHIGERHWPAFNVADSCIVLGAAVLMADSLLTKNDKIPVRA